MWQAVEWRYLEAGVPVQSEFYNAHWRREVLPGLWSSETEGPMLWIWFRKLLNHNWFSLSQGFYQRESYKNKGRDMYGTGTVWWKIFCVCVHIVQVWLQRHSFGFNNGGDISQSDAWCFCLDNEIASYSKTGCCFCCCCCCCCCFTNSVSMCPLAFVCMSKRMNGNVSHYCVNNV